MDRDTIFDNIERYFDNIDDLIRDLGQVGILSFEEFDEAAREAYAFIPKAIRDRIKEKFTPVQNNEEQDWAQALQDDTMEAYQNYLDNYPEGNYREDAKLHIRALMSQSAGGNEPLTFTPPQAAPTHNIDLDELKEAVEAIRLDLLKNNPEQAVYEYIKQHVISGELSKDILIEAIADDWNFINHTAAHDLYMDGILTEEDFMNAGIDKGFINLIARGQSDRREFAFRQFRQAAKVPSTEIYFWGMPSSGKTCALGAILSCANSGLVASAMDKDNNCDGYDYMNRLANIFKKSGIGELPPGTPGAASYEMGFNLWDKKGRIHPLTCVDLAGEMIEYMYYYDADREQLSEFQIEALETVTKVLSESNNDNRKMHFFVLEYGGEKRIYKGLTQADLLQGAMAYIQRTGILKKKTDAIYILITKADKIKATSAQDMQEKILEYIEEHYLGFYNLLSHICRTNEINGGKVLRQPFTLGKVCFQNYCKYDDKAASAVVQILLDRSYDYTPKKLNKLMASFEN